MNASLFIHLLRRFSHVCKTQQPICSWNICGDLQFEKLLETVSSSVCILYALIDQVPIVI